MTRVQQMKKKDSNLNRRRQISRNSLQFAPFGLHLRSTIFLSCMIGYSQTLTEGHQPWSSILKELLGLLCGFLLVPAQTQAVPTTPMRIWSMLCIPQIRIGVFYDIFYQAALLNIASILSILHWNDAARLWPGHLLGNTDFIHSRKVPELLPTIL